MYYFNKKVCVKKNMKPHKKMQQRELALHLSNWDMISTVRPSQKIRKCLVSADAVSFKFSICICLCFSVYHGYKITPAALSRLPLSQ